MILMKRKAIDQSAPNGTSRRSALAFLYPLSIVCLLGATTAACDHHRVEESSTETFAFNIHERAVVEIRVDDGSVEVTGGAAETIEVVFTTRARATDTTRARALLQTARTEARQEGDRIRIRAGSASGNTTRHGANVWTDVRVQFPSGARNIELDILTEDGRVDVSGVSGSVVAETGDGRMRLSRVDGSAKLRTGDGSITVQEVTGVLDVVSGDGRIRLDGTFTQLRAATGDGSIRVISRETATISNDWSLRTADGSIELSLPRDTDAELDATSADGRILNHLSRFEGSERKNRLRGKIGSGGASIVVTTLDGRITLKES